MRSLSIAITFVAYFAFVAFCMWQFSPWFILIPLLFVPQFKYTESGKDSLTDKK